MIEFYAVIGFFGVILLIVYCWIEKINDNKRIKKLNDEIHKLINEIEGKNETTE